MILNFILNAPIVKVTPLIKDSYQSIPIRSCDRFKASILTTFGQYSPTRMSYGFRNGIYQFLKKKKKKKKKTF